jgi:hypothetical protein
MFDVYFDGRNRLISELNKLGDGMGRSLRQNVLLFSIDDNAREVAYVTEEGKIISGNFNIGDDLTLTNLVVQESDVFTDSEKFEQLAENKVHDFVGHLHEDHLTDARTSFVDLLDFWTTRSRFTNVTKRLEEKSAKFGESMNILQNEEFSRFTEVIPGLIEFLKENKDSIGKIAEIKNAVKLSRTVSNAFNLPHITFDELNEAGKYTSPRS